ncbi:MAG TPA: hypothetical protein VF081_04465 [Solirubrobacterales bacterium]
MSTIAIDGLRRCKKCQTLYRDSSSSKGFCPADGGTHERSGLNYQLTFGIPTSDAQPAWRRCTKCEAIYFSGDRKGRCAADPNAQAHHTPDDSRDLSIPHGRPETEHVQAGWEFCTKCNVLFYSRSTEPNMNHCTGGGEHAAHPDAFHFTLTHGQPLPVRID